eukprot:jgi/Chrpa1/25500/Chrysochromulina_OHIO_Genome00026263-RA
MRRYLRHPGAICCPAPRALVALAVADAQWAASLAAAF